VNISRRKFFTGITAMAMIASTGGPALSSITGDPRIKAWRLLDESRIIFATEGKGQAYFTKTAELFDHLMIHFKPSNPPSDEVLVQECRDLLRRSGKYEGAPPHAHWRTCHNSTFAIMIVRTGLKDYKLPMIQARNWKPFAKNFTKIVMAA